MSKRSLLIAMLQQFALPNYIASESTMFISSTKDRHTGDFMFKCLSQAEDGYMLSMPFYIYIFLDINIRT